MNFFVGQKVVCVNDEPPRDPRWGLLGLTKDAVYTVRWFGMRGFPERAYIRVEEVLRSWPGKPQFDDWPYDAIRFRPIIERKTDISIFKKLLIPTNQQVKA